MDDEDTMTDRIHDLTEAVGSGAQLDPAVCDYKADAACR